MNSTILTLDTLPTYKQPLGAVNLSNLEKLKNLDIYFFQEQIVSSEGSAWIHHAFAPLPAGTPRTSVIFRTDLKRIAVIIGFLSEHIFKDVARRHIAHRCLRYDSEGELCALRDAQVNTKIVEMGGISHHELYIDMLKIINAK